MLTRIICTRDSENEICRVINEPLSRNPYFLLITGGLGPTRDDMTTDAVSKVAQTEIWIDETTLVRISECGGIPRMQTAATLQSGKDSLGGHDLDQSCRGLALNST